MPIKGKKCSHTGNMVFPDWEHDIPTVGINYVPKVISLSGVMMLIKSGNTAIP